MKEPPANTSLLRMRGLPWTATAVDVRAFFSSYAVLEAVFTFNSAGKPTGECFVRFNGAEANHAKRKKHRQYMGHRFVECWIATEEEMQAARGDRWDHKQPANCFCDGRPLPNVNSSCNCLRVRGVPWTATEQDVRSFFRGFIVRQVLLVFNAIGKLTGECYVQLSSSEEVLQALKQLDGQYLGRRFVECWPATEGEMAAERQHSLRQNRALQSSLVLRMRGLPFSARELDIYDFLASYGVEGVPGTSCIEFGSDARPTGWAYVRLGSEPDMQRCLELHRKARMGGRYVEMARATEQEMFSVTMSAAVQAARPRESLSSNEDGEGCVVRLRGLPFMAGEADIVHFLDGIEIAPRGVHLVLDVVGRRSGECLVELASADAATQALARDRCRLGGRYIEVLSSTREALVCGPSVQQPAQRAHRRRGYIVKLRGLPFSATGLDVSRNLFADLQIVPRGIHMVLEDNGRPHGQAFVEVASRSDVEQVLQRNGCEFSSRHAPQAAHTGRYVEVFSVSFADMMRAGELLHEEEVTIQRRHLREPLGLILRGLLLQGVEEGMAAHRRGCEQYVGRRITHVDGVAVACPEALDDALQRPANCVSLRLLLPRRGAAELAADLAAEDEAGQLLQPPLPPEVAACVGAPLHRGLQQLAAAAFVGPALRQFGDFAELPAEADPVRYSRETRVLLVGEGTFAYAAALCQRLGAGCRVVATGYEPEADARRLPNAAANLDLLVRLGVAVRHGMDATRLHVPDWGHDGLFDCIRWNHPHSGAYPSGKTNISHNQCLLEGFLQSAESVLVPGGVVHVVSSQHALKHWRIEDMGGDLLMCTRVERHRNPFPSYEPQRSRGGALPDHEVTVKIYTFQRVREIHELRLQNEAEAPPEPPPAALPVAEWEALEPQVDLPAPAAPAETGTAAARLAAMVQGPTCADVALRIPRPLALLSPGAWATVRALLAALLPCGLAPPPQGGWWLAAPCSTVDGAAAGRGASIQGSPRFAASLGGAPPPAQGFRQPLFRHALALTLPVM